MVELLSDAGPQFLGYHGVWVELTLVVVIALIVDGAHRMDRGDNLLNWRYVPAGIIVIVGLAALVSTAPIFNSDRYQKMLQVETVSNDRFNAEIHPIPVNKMRAVDEKYAKKIAEDRLGQEAGLSSVVVIGEMSIQRITGSFAINGGVKLEFDNSLVYVAPLEHSGFNTWSSNTTTRGYVIVDATDYRKVHLVTEVNGKELHLRYLESSYFGDNVERHIRNSGYRSRGITDPNLELDSNGRPYWVIAEYEPKIGFGGEDSIGVITVDAQTGELGEYSISNAPEWIDHFQPADFVEAQINSWGEYKDGWRNSWWEKKGVESVTPGLGEYNSMIIVYSQGKSFWYTGIKGASSNEGTSGFILVDAKTKAAKVYRIAGVNETEAQKIAMDQEGARLSHYVATDPILYNIRGMATYFMSYKGESGNVMGHCLLAVTNNRQAIGCGKTREEAERAYLRILSGTNHDGIKDGPVKHKAEKHVVRGITLEGDVYYILLEGVKGKEFSGSSRFFRELRWTKEGHKISISYGEGESEAIPLDSFENLDVEI